MAKREREARREGAAAPVEVSVVPLRGTIDYQTSHESLEHVATGLAADRYESICAAVLRAQREA